MRENSSTNGKAGADDTAKAKRQGGRPKVQGKFAMVPETLFDDPAIPFATIVVYGALALYANRETGLCFPSNGTLAQKAKVSYRYIPKLLKILEAAGWIDRSERGGKTYYTWVHQVPQVRSQPESVPGGKRPGSGA